MSGSMSRIAKNAFRWQKQIIDRFHVQKEFKDALQDLRIQYRWQAMEAENKEIRKCKKRKNTEFKAEIFFQWGHTQAVASQKPLSAV